MKRRGFFGAAIAAVAAVLGVKPSTAMFRFVGGPRDGESIHYDAQPPAWLTKSDHAPFFGNYGAIEQHVTGDTLVQHSYVLNYTDRTFTFLKTRTVDMAPLRFETVTMFNEDRQAEGRPCT